MYAKIETYLPPICNYMIKLLRSTATILIILTLSSITTTYGQDSVKRAKPAAVKPTPTKPAVKYNPYAKKPYYPVKAATVTAPSAQQPATTNAVATKPWLQPADPALLNDKSLKGQYQYLLTRVYHYQQPLISALWKNFSDTLNITKRKLVDINGKITTQTKRADSLQKELSAKDQNLSVSNSRVDQVSLLGMPVSKATYNWIMWGLVITFGAIAAIVIARAGSHSREAKYRTKLYSELEEEYKTYKAKANEKEKKLARELQTERNKLDELKGNE
ncbi:hypothetical protein A0256_09275 [Mucilaginibacter sp. PAMC 26640]|nr:hypothetical protein A0256_09275 [Mucilaginibacter sp. PAMC 26640]